LNPKGYKYVIKNRKKIRFKLKFEVMKKILLLVGVMMMVGHVNATISWMGNSSASAQPDDSQTIHFYVEMWDSYDGCHAAVMIKEGDNWVEHLMTQGDNNGNNSTWTADINVKSNSTAYYYHGWDNWTGDVADGSEESSYPIAINPTTKSGGNSNWNDGGNWCDGTEPSSTSAHYSIAHDLVLNQDVAIGGITINNGVTFTASDATARILTISKSSAGDEATFVNNGIWANGTGGSTVLFTGSPSSGDARHQISGTNAFQNLTVNKTEGLSNVGASFGENSTVSGTLRIGSGGFISTAPPTDFYGEDAILDFNQGVGANYAVNSGDYTWSTTQVPNNITITSGTVTLNEARSFSGLLLIQAGAEIATGDILTLESNENGTASLVSNGTVDGNVTVERYLAQDVFHYIASPINYLSGSFNDLSLGLTAGEGNDDFRKYETSSNTWIDILNGPNGNDPLMGSETFVIGKGYAIAYAGENKTLSLSGTLNNGNIDVAVSSGGVGNNSGANLIGNPYPSTMKVSAFLAANNSTNGTVNQTIGGTLYFWDEPASGSFEKGDYAYRTSTTGTPGGGNKTPTDYINPGQGFFVSAASDGNVAFRNDQREHGTSTFFKSESLIKDFKLSVQNIATSDMNTLTVVFDENSTTGFDALYDAPKWQGNPDLALYSLLGDQKLAIQSLPSIEEQNTVALGLNVSKTGDYLFNVHTLLNFDASTPIFLEDKQTEDIIDLTVNPEYVFNVSESGVINDRFVLHFGTITDIDEAVSMEKPSIYISGNTLHILNLDSDYTLRITDITGRVLVEEQQSANQTLQLPASMNTGVYVVEMTSENQRFTQKLFVR